MPNKTAASKSDFDSVYWAKCHNIGSGGVKPNGGIFILSSRNKRKNQFKRRVARAIGE